MSTPDGITDEDWDRVHELAVQIVNYSAEEHEAAGALALTSLLALLDQLDLKYGAKPSLLATRADYVESSESRERLLLAAYSESERIGDDNNRELIAHSLSEFYIEEVRNLEEGAKWLGIWREALGIEPVEEDRAEIARLETVLLDGGAA